MSKELRAIYWIERMLVSGMVAIFGRLRREVHCGRASGPIEETRQRNAMAGTFAIVSGLLALSTAPAWQGPLRQNSRAGQA